MSGVRRAFFVIYDDERISYPMEWMMTRSPDVVIECVCFESVDEVDRRCLFGYMCLVRHVGIRSWERYINGGDMKVIPISGDHDHYTLMSQKRVVESIYTTTRDVCGRLYHYGIIAPIIYVDISDNTYKYAYFYIYDEKVLSNVKEWIETIHHKFGYCVCVKTIDVETARMCVYGYALRRKNAPHVVWREGLRCKDLRLEHVTSDARNGLYRVLGEVVIEGPYIHHTFY